IIVLLVRRYDELNQLFNPGNNMTSSVERKPSGVVEPAKRPLTVAKARVSPSADKDPELTYLVVAYFVSATIWLVIGTFIGEFMGLMRIWPELGGVSFLSFGRL